jgi:hypothetical protein
MVYFLVLQTSILRSLSVAPYASDIMRPVISRALGACTGNRFVQCLAGRVVQANMIAFMLERMQRPKGFMGYMLHV